jgi:Domain of unknown function (DUF4129)
VKNLDPTSFPERVDAVKKAVLAEREFQHPKSWVETWLVPWLAGIIDRISDLGPVLRYALIAALVVLTLAIVVWVARSLLGISRRGDVATLPQASSRPLPDERTADELRRAAADAARSGAFAESIRLSWMTVIALLEASTGASGRPHVARADFEYVADARRAGAPAKAIADLAVEFQRVRFGGIEPGEGSATRCLELAQAVERWGSAPENRAESSHG